MRVAIVGAGILGSAIAHELSLAGASVTMVDSGAEGAATPASFSWINACFGNRPPYFDLRVRSMRLWRDWAKRFPDAPIGFGGSLSWELEGEALAGHVGEHAGWGYAIRRIEADEIRELEPGIARPPAEAALAADEGAVESVRFAGMLAKASGAGILRNTPVLGIAHDGGRVTGVRTAAGNVAADAVVVAAGLGSASLVEPFGTHLPMRHAPGLTGVADAGSVRLSRIIVTPQLEIRQRQDGRLLFSLHVPSEPGAAFDSRAAIEVAISSLRELFADPAIRFADAIAAHRPIPLDGFPAVGSVEGVAGLHVCVTHSGITLAPVLAQAVAREVLTGEADPMLAPWRPGRFTVIGRA